MYYGFRLSSILCCALWFIAFVANGQVIENVKATFADGKVFVMYDLTGGGEKRRYAIELFGSHNDFSSPLKRVKGDVGKNVKGGKAKKIEWDAASELGPSGDEIIFRVKFELIPLPLVFKSPAEGSSLKRGKRTTVQWEGGAVNQSVRFELYKNGERVTIFTEAKNTGQYVWRVPKHLRKGSYMLKLKIGEESDNSGAFKVKPRVPMLLKLSPFIIAGGALIAFWPKSERPHNEDLAAAPGPK